MVSVILPDGFTIPYSTSAVAGPPAWPRSQPSTIARTRAWNDVTRTDDPLLSTTTTFWLTARMSSRRASCSAGRSQVSRSYPSDSWLSPSPRNASTTPAFLATSTASACALSPTGFFLSVENPGANGTSWPTIAAIASNALSVSYTHLRAHETDSYLVCRLLLE